MMNGFAISALSIAIEVALLLGAVLALCQLLRPGLRVLIYRAAFAVAALAPLTLLFEKGSRPGLWTIPTSGQPLALTDGGAAALPFAAPGAPHSVLAIVLIVWAAGIALALAKTMRAYGQLARIYDAGTPLSEGQMTAANALRRRVGVDARIKMRVSDAVSTPLVFGFVRPKLLLPASLSESALRMALTHEFCHLRNGDTAWLFAERLACALHWYNPLVWFCAHRHRDDAELVCDDAATGIVSTKDYATALIEIARMALPASPAAAVAMSGRGLSQRVRALLSRTGPSAPPTLRLQGAVAAGAMAAMFLLSAAQIVSAETWDSDLTSAAAARSAGLIFVEAPAGVRIDVGTGGACWGGGRCVFEHPLSAVVEIRAHGRGQVELLGCDQSRAGRCAVQMSSTPVYISARVQGQ
ncbi:MAG: M56 family metallopeptidase [Hyphomonadaceae bacterium]